MQISLNMRIFAGLALAISAASADAEKGSAEFFAGAMHAPKVDGLGGLGYSFGIAATWDLSDQYFIPILLQVSGLGSDARGTEGRVGSYMAGLGYRYQDFFFFPALGLHDYMIIAPDAHVTTTIDPITGSLVTESTGVTHNNKFGYLLAVGYRYYFTRAEVSQSFGWYVGSLATLAGNFGSGSFTPFWSLNLSVGSERAF